MTETMLGDAEVMPGLGPVPLLQRQSASESRWTRPVPTSREAAFRIVRFCTADLTKMKAAVDIVIMQCSMATEQSKLNARS